MKTFHKGISELIENEVYYLGVLEGYNVNVFDLKNPENISLLLANKIIKVSNIKQQENTIKTIVLETNIVINNKLYGIHPLLIKEIMTEIDCNVRSNNEGVFNDIEKINREVYKLNKTEDKIKKIIEIKDSYIDSIISFLDYEKFMNTKEHFLFDYLISSFLAYEPDFLSSYVLNNQNNKNLVIWYCLCKKFPEYTMEFNYDTKILDNLYNTMHNWHSRGTIINYCNEEIKKLNHCIPNLKSKITPFEQVVIIDHLRNNYETNSIDTKTLIDFLEKSKISALAIDKSLLLIKELIDCEQKEYDNASQRARMINKLTNSSITNIRNKIREYDNSKDLKKINLIISSLMN